MWNEYCHFDLNKIISIFLLFSCKSVPIKFPCKVCSFEVKSNDHTSQWDLCDKWTHTNFVCVKQKYSKIKLDPLPWYWTMFWEEIPFSKISNSDLKSIFDTAKSALLPMTVNAKSIEKLEKFWKAFVNSTKFLMKLKIQLWLLWYWWN